MSLPPSGWYPQPEGHLRYWDGHAWTEQTAPAPSVAVGVGSASGTGAAADYSYHPSGISAQQIPGFQERPDYVVPTARPQKGWLWAIGIVVGLFVIFPLIGLIAFTSRFQSVSTNPILPTAAFPTYAASSSGRTLYVDGYSVTVGKVVCNQSTAATGNTTVTPANGAFCKVPVSILQVESSVLALNLSTLSLLDSGGNSASALAIPNHDPVSLLNVDAGPNITVNGNVWVDAPKDFKPATLQLDSSTGSVTISLS